MMNVTSVGLLLLIVCSVVFLVFVFRMAILLDRENRQRWPNFYKPIVTGLEESEIVLSLIGRCYADFHFGIIQLPISWTLIQKKYSKELSGEYPRRISGLTREYSDLIASGSQSQYPPELLFNGIKHAFENGWLEVINGSEEDSLHLTDKGFALFMDDNSSKT